MSLLRSIASGVAGACALTLVHETARRLIPHAPRVDVIGMRAIAKPMRAAGYEPPAPDRLHQVALAGELFSNSLYYSLVGAGGASGRWTRGAILGLLGGIGAVFLPRPMGLGRQPHHRTPVTQILTICWYLIGGLAAAAIAEVIEDESSRSRIARATVPARVERIVHRVREAVGV